MNDSFQINIDAVHEAGPTADTSTHLPDTGTHLPDADINMTHVSNTMIDAQLAEQSYQDWTDGKVQYFSMAMAQLNTIGMPIEGSFFFAGFTSNSTGWKSSRKR